MVFALLYNPSIVPWHAVAQSSLGVFSMIVIANFIVHVLVALKDDVYCSPVDNLTMLLFAAIYELCGIQLLNWLFKTSGQWNDDALRLKSVDWVLDVSTRLLGVQWAFEMTTAGVMGTHGWTNLSWMTCDHPRLLIFTSFYFMFWIFHFLWELSVLQLNWDMIAHHMLLLIFMVFLTDHSFEFIRSTEYRGTLFGAFLGGVIHGFWEFPMSTYHCDQATQEYKYMIMRFHFYQATTNTIIFHCVMSWVCIAYYGRYLNTIQKVFSYIPLMINSFIEMNVMRTLYLASEKKRKDAETTAAAGSAYVLIEKV